MRKNAKYRRSLARAPLLVRLVIERLAPEASLSECHHGTWGWDATVTLRGASFRIVYDRGCVDVCQVRDDGHVQLCPASFLGAEESVAGTLTEAIRTAAETRRGPTSR